MRRIARAQQRRSTTTAGERLRNNPGTYWTIPVVAAAVGFGTNYVGVQMLYAAALQHAQMRIVDCV